MAFQAISLCLFISMYWLLPSCKKTKTDSDLKDESSKVDDNNSEKVLFEEGEIVLRPKSTEFVEEGESSSGPASGGIEKEVDVPKESKIEELPPETEMEVLPEFSADSLNVLYFNEDKVLAADSFSRAIVFKQDMSYAAPVALGLALPSGYQYYNFADQHLWQISKDSIAVTTKAFKVPMTQEKLTMAAAKFEEAMGLQSEFEVIGLEQTRLFARDENQVLLSTFDGQVFHHSRFENARLAKDLADWSAASPLVPQVVVAGSTLGEDGVFFLFNQGIAVYKFMSFEIGYVFLKSYPWATPQDFGDKKVGVSVSLMAGDFTLAIPQYTLDSEGLKQLTLALKEI